MSVCNLLVKKKRVDLKYVHLHNKSDQRFFYRFQWRILDTSDGVFLSEQSVLNKARNRFDPFPSSRVILKCSLCIKQCKRHVKYFCAFFKI